MRRIHGLQRRFEAFAEKRSKRSNGSKLRSAQVTEKMERETGLEPVTSSLGSWHSTTELLPPNHAPQFNLWQRVLHVRLAHARETAQSDHFHQRDEDVHHTDAAHPAAEPGAVPDLLPRLSQDRQTQVRKPAPFPSGNPGKDQQKYANLKTQNDKQKGRRLFEPTILSIRHQTKTMPPVPNRPRRGRAQS
jgi:hypothetical protein